MKRQFLFLGLLITQGACSEYSNVSPSSAGGTGATAAGGAHSGAGGASGGGSSGGHGGASTLGGAASGGNATGGVTAAGSGGNGAAGAVSNGGNSGNGTNGGSAGMNTAGGGSSGGAAGAINGGASGAGTAGSAAGGVSAGGVSAGGNPNDPLNASPRCTSAVTWTSALPNSRHMRPGESCAASKDCHASGAPQTAFTISGTVYPTGHEPDDCSGYTNEPPTNELVIVTVTDSTGAQFSVRPNSTGNFYLADAVVPPLLAKISAGTKERVMVDPVPNGDCNSCHTQSGTLGAPGRITYPF